MKALILTLLLIISSCEQQAEKKKTTKTETKETVEKITESNFTILPFDQSWHWVFKNVKPTELTQTEIDEIELILEKVITENNQNQKENLKKHNEKYPKYQWKETGFELDLNKGYYRQYVPVINENGEKEVWINFFCSTMKDNWKTDLVMVHDGGNCFFNIKVNLTKKNYSDLRINGSA
ncbi:hypothetical protein [Lutibacter citreus]|uniref:hypothetical protein n=1 Tax=Lutibacter citreus TaxID=2138210 RepID=UPI000DBE595F|nr:hypothetical protein [Lutibacter citreus]